MLLLTAPSSPNIPDQIQTTPSRLPLNIPLRNLPPRERPDPDSRSTSSLGLPGDIAPHPARRSSESRASSESGDIAEQLADEEDPIQFRLADDIHDTLLSKPKSQKRVKVELPPGYDESSCARRVINKEDIEVPIARPRRVPRAERFLAAIMGSPIHGLTGRPLMYVLILVLESGPTRRAPT
ncbi:hypothetical protein IMZ48_07710 [Candidatus Bathyarchaeota archaeon]|nr:hypothetical protein [Candidatus Bathyarchaeota archaeon]